MSKDILEAMLKKAMGYVAEEVSQEYVYDSEGVKHLSKEKVMQKYFPPDVTALKSYMELTANNEDEFNNMTDEELEKEKIKYLELLKKTVQKKISKKNLKIFDANSDV